MKINLSKQDLKEFAKYLQALDTNIEEGDYFNDVLSSASPVSKQKEPFEIKELSVKEYIDNPYYKIVKPSKAKEGNIHLCYDNYKKNQGFVYDEIVLGEFAREKTPFGYFNEDFHFLTLNEKGTTWMSVTPHEINTMKDDIAKAYGNVVTLGLGLGYYPFMVSNKSIVKHVTIIENNQDIINIFNKHILPFFPCKEKIQVINADAFSFLSKPIDADYLFADLWHLPEDGLPMYAKILPFEDKHKDCHFSYWIEKSMLALIRRAIIILIDEELNGSTDEDYKFEETFSDHLINQVHFILKRLEINSTKDIEELLDFISLKNITSKLEF